MKNIIKGLIDQGHEVSIQKSGKFYIFDLDNGQWMVSFDNWGEAEDVLLDYIINEANL